MKVQILHYGRVKNGKLIWDIPDLFQDQLLELEGQNIVMSIKKRHQKPTMSQYGYYRGVVLPLCYEAERFKDYDSKDQIHERYFAPQFLGHRQLVDLPGGKEEILFIRSLSDLNKDEMTDFMTRVIMHCETELGIVPPPPELAYSKYYK